MTDNIKSLSPCPFCSSMRTAIGYNGQPAVTIFAMCQDCGATGPTQQYSSGMSFDWEAAWQRRAPVADSAMAKDAERYRWLRRRVVMMDYSDDASIVIMAFKEEGPTGEFLDDQIDVALAASEPKKEPA